MRYARAAQRRVRVDRPPTDLLRPRARRPARRRARGRTARPRGGQPNLRADRRRSTRATAALAPKVPDGLSAVEPLVKPVLESVIKADLERFEIYALDVMEGRVSL